MGNMGQTVLSLGLELPKSMGKIQRRLTNL